MDLTTFERKIEQLNRGEMVKDPAVFSYAGDCMYEYKRLFEALRRCCALQDQNIDLLRKMNKGLQETIKDQRKCIADLVRKLNDVGASPFDEQMKGADNEVF